MTRPSLPLTRPRITRDSIRSIRRALVPLLLVASAFACEERFSGIEDQAGGGPNSGGSGAGAGTTGGSSTTGGTGASGGSDTAGSSGAGGTSSGGASGGTGPQGGEGGEAGEPGLTPPEIPTDGLLLWLRADRGVTEVEGRVTKWEDGSGAANDARQTANNAQPSFLAEAFGGRPAVAFGAGQFLRLPAGFSDFSQGLSVFALGSFEEETICSAVLHLGNAPEVDDIALGQWNGDLLYEVADEYPVSDLFAFDTPALVTVVHRPSTNVEMRWNQDLGATPSMMLPAVVSRAENVVGKSQYDGCSSMGGRLAELLLYDRAVSDDELVEIESYLQQRYDCCD